MQEELKAIIANGTWEKVNPAKNSNAQILAHKPLGNRWVYKIKYNPDNSVRYKARLVVKGYKQQYGIDYTETFAPVVTLKTVRAIMAICTAKGLKPYQMDVKNAFTQSELKETIYMKQPEGF